MRRILFLLSLLFICSCKQEVNNTTIEVPKPKTSKSILEQLKNPSQNHVLVVSHRGDWRYAPENSLEALKRCIALGVDIIELDVRFTKDGHLVAIHDKTVNRTTNGSGLVS